GQPCPDRVFRAQPCGPAGVVPAPAAAGGAIAAPTRLLSTPVQGLLDAPAEPVRLRKALRRQAAGVGAGAAPLGEFLDGGAEFAAGGILPGQAILGVERRDVGQAAIPV